MSSGRRPRPLGLRALATVLALSGCSASAARSASPSSPATTTPAEALGLTVDALATTSSLAPATAAPSPGTTAGPTTSRRTAPPAPTLARVLLPPSTWPSTLPPTPASTVPLTFVRPDAPNPMVTNVIDAEGRTTSCLSVMHIGDSTSVGMMNSFVAPSDRLDAQYARVGVKDIRIDAVGGRAVKETRGEDLNAQEVAVVERGLGYRGCWVIAIGTNDAANIAHGVSVTAAERIERMMSVIGDDPVLWVNVRTTTDVGFYAEANMAAWNQALIDASYSHPSMRIYDWASDARPEWFLSDGIHYTGVGYANRAMLIADALAAAFPA